MPSFVYKNENFVDVLKPVSTRPSRAIITLPHDGLPKRDFEGLYTPREKGVLEKDMRVWPLVRDIFLECPVTVIRGLVSRKFLDYNRSFPEGISYDHYPPETAMDDGRLLFSYEFYHQSISQAIEEAIAAHEIPNVLLIDFHGFTEQPPYAPEEGYDLILGTGNQVTIHHGEPDRRLAAFMSERGYKVFLPDPQDTGEVERWYSADFTTRHYAEKYGVNVIQVEVSDEYRQKDSQTIGKKLSSDIAEFLKQI